jgi:hypothetical protein
LLQAAVAAVALLALPAAAQAPVEGAPRAAPSAEVFESALAVAGGEAAAPRDPLYALLSAGRSVPVETADRLLHEVYDAYPTPTTRSRAFALAAETASEAGRHDLALAWIDWAIGEAERAPERERLLAERLGSGVAIARAAGHPVLGRGYARRAGGLAAHFSDIGARRSVRFDALALECPDVIGERFVRVRAEADPGTGRLAVPWARCDYVPLAAARIGDDEGGFTLYAVRSRMNAKERTESVVDQGLDAREVEARRIIARRLNALDAQVIPLLLEGDDALMGYARLWRLGVNDVAAFAYATAARGDAFYVGAASAPVWEWPPEALGRRAETALRTALEAGLADGG